MSQQIAFDWHTDEDAFLHEVGRRFASSEAVDELLTEPQLQPGAGDGWSDAATDFAVTDFARAPDAPVRDGERALALFALRAMAALLFVLMAAGGASMSPEQSDRIAIERDLGVVLQLDQDAWRARDRERYDALVAPDVPAAWVGEWRDNWGARSETGRIYGLTLGPTQRLSDDLIQAEVTVNLPRTNWWQPAVVRETRFYRSVDDQWLRTMPPDDYWGELQTLETPRFTFRYFEADAESVPIVAEKLESSVAELYEMFGLEARAGGRRTVIILRPGVERTQWWDRRDIEIASPTLSQIPRGTTDADYLTERAFSRIASRILSTGGGGYRWAFMYTVMRGWLSADLLVQPSMWRQESDEVFRSYAAAQWPLALDDIDEFYVGGKPGRDTVLWRYAAASSLLDYIVEREGREALPRLLDAFSEHGTWSSLIEDMLGESLDEFTAGWNAYLAAEYGLENATE